MKECFFTPTVSALGEITEKRSKFIAEIRPVSDEKAAMEFVEEVRLKHRDARHTVFAYLFPDGKKRYSDDGEPSGTAGAPIMDILEKKELCGCVVTVTRYFGGILLGTGGLVRAYSAAAAKAVEGCNPQKKVLRTKVGIKCGYNLYNRLPGLLSKYSGRILSSEFSESVFLQISLSPGSVKSFSDRITELSAGETLIENFGDFYESDIY